MTETGETGEVGVGGMRIEESGRGNLLIDLLERDRPPIDPGAAFGERAGFNPSNASINSAASFGESVLGLMPAYRSFCTRAREVGEGGRGRGVIV